MAHRYHGHATWWDLDFSALRAELKKVFRQDIPVKECDEWERGLANSGQGTKR